MYRKVCIQQEPFDISEQLAVCFSSISESAAQQSVALFSNSELANSEMNCFGEIASIVKPEVAVNAPIVQMQVGAVVPFIGIVRPFSCKLQGAGLLYLDIQSYPIATQKSLEAIVDAAFNQFDLLGVLLVHRIGALLPGEHIVLVVCMAAFRAHAFDATRYIVEALKTRAIFWKKEVFHDGGFMWVDS